MLINIVKSVKCKTPDKACAWITIPPFPSPPKPAIFLLHALRHYC